MDTFVTEHRKWSHADVAALLISYTALSTLAMDDALKVVGLMRPKRIKAGTVLIQEGASNTGHMLLILRGEAVVQNESLKKADALTLSTLTTGHIVGEMGLFDDGPRSATCTAVTEMDVAILALDSLSTLISHEPAVGCKLLAALLQRISARLRNTTQKLRALTQVNRTLEQELNKLHQLNQPAAPFLNTGSNNSPGFLLLP